MNVPTVYVVYGIPVYVFRDKSTQIVIYIFLNRIFIENHRHHRHPYSINLYSLGLHRHHRH